MADETKVETDESVEASPDGWKSRKLWVAVLAMGLIFGGFYLCKDRNVAFWAFVTGELTAAGLLKAANLVEKFMSKPTP